MIALTTSFTLWCMPQVFFYGLYTVLGQILAAKDHFLTYAWSSTGANIISCAGFTGFILLFSKANEQPLEFWTADKIALTAGTWTLGVAFQALILFLPLARIGFKYKPSFGLGGFGLRSMGPVALGSLGVVITSEICGIILTRIATSAPQRAHELTGASLFSVAGNATIRMRTHCSSCPIHSSPYRYPRLCSPKSPVPSQLRIWMRHGTTCQRTE